MSSLAIKRLPTDSQSRSFRGVTPDQFIRKWQTSTLKERSAAQEHFIDLCHLLEEPTPGTDATGADYSFERGAIKTTGAGGWADVWKRGCFGWEYKAKGRDLNAALSQLQQYALALNNPPLLIVSDFDRIRIHTNWTNTVSRVHEITLEDLRDADKRQIIKWAMSDPERLRPTQTRQQLTEDAAAEFAILAQRLAKDHDPLKVAHFINRLVFCMFAEDVGLLPDKMFEKMLRASVDDPPTFQENASSLFRAMAQKDGKIGFTKIEWFNGGLFENDEALPLDAKDIALCIKAAELGWEEIDPSIFGTLFERGLDPAKRTQLGAHYTDRDKIMMIIEPIIIRPLLAEWAAVHERIEQTLTAASGKARSTRTKAEQAATSLYRGFLERLKGFRVLDPACGSGNFLYLALRALKDIEHRAGLEAEALGLHREFPQVGPECVLGLEVNEYASELARVTVWIGEIQWMRRNGFSVSRNPILKPLNNIRTCDALIDEHGAQCRWPAVDVVIGNPPFLGAKLMKRALGADETAKIRAAFNGQLAAFTDLVTYWYEKAREMIQQGTIQRAGLVATNSIRKNTNLPVLQRISVTTDIFEAWNEERWTVEGAAVDVSLICFGNPGNEAAEKRLNGTPVTHINPDLTSGLDLTKARVLAENANGAYLGIQKSGPFDVPGTTARAWMALPVNPNGQPNSAVLRPYWNGDDITGRPRDFWFIDLPLGLSEGAAALYEEPFRHISTMTDEDGKTLKELRKELGIQANSRWWDPWRPRPEMRERALVLPRYIVTAEVAAHRFFVWVRPPVLPDKNLIVIPRDDDAIFGILHSRFHELWSLRKGSDLQDRPRYTHTSTFATFPFPSGMRPCDPPPDVSSSSMTRAIAEAARELDEYRKNWLNPPDLINIVPEIVPGFPDRIVPKNAAAEEVLAQRTMTKLYNEKPTWLVEAHRKIDAAVAAAYGWPDDLTDDEVLEKLLDLNLSRALSETPNRLVA
ncbi:MAG TPA: DNA methyltransferase [Sphingomicrobium sp.]|nr:DNA methyltransferase [Sphingomicrobium sp.]